MNDDDVARCKKCGSSQIQAVKRGYTLTRGIWGAGDTRVVCLKCGHEADPGPTTMEKLREREDFYKGIARDRRAKALTTMSDDEKVAYLKREERLKPLYIATFCLAMPLLLFVGCQGCKGLEASGHSEAGQWCFMMCMLAGGITSLWARTRWID